MIDKSIVANTQDFMDCFNCTRKTAYVKKDLVRTSLRIREATPLTFYHISVFLETPEEIVYKKLRPSKK